MGMFSTTRREGPRPKLRVTLRSCTPGRPHEAHSMLGKVEGDDEEAAKRAELDDCFGLEPVDRDAADDELALARLPIALALDDFADETSARSSLAMAGNTAGGAAGRSGLPTNRFQKLMLASPIRKRKTRWGAHSWSYYQHC
jgi:hypothetical protein